MQISYLDVIASETPIARSLQVAKVQFLLKADLDSANSTCNLASDEVLTATRAFVVEENAVASEHAVSLTIVHSVPVCSHLRHSVGGARVEKCLLILRRGCSAEHLGGASLVVLNCASSIAHMVANSIEKAESSSGDNISSVFRVLERHADVGLGTKIEDLIRLDLVNPLAESRRVCKISVVELQLGGRDMGITVNVIKTLGVEVGGPSDDAVHLIPLGKKELRKVGAVLSCNAGDEGLLAGSFGGHPCVATKLDTR